MIERFGSGGSYEDRVGYSRVVVTHGPGGDTGWSAGSTALVGGVVQHPGDAFSQTLVAFQSALFALERAGFSRGHTVQTRMYVVDIAADADAVGLAHAELFGAIRPAATMVGTTALIEPGLLIEVEVVAWRPTDEPAA